jgi:hypothetical protein
MSFRTTASLLLAVVLLLGFGGCYVTTITLIPPGQAKVDHAYLGDWDATDTNSKDHTAIVIRNIDDKLYYVEIREKDKEPQRYVGFTTDVKGATFAQVRQLQDDGSVSDQWILERVGIKNGKLGIRQMDDDFLKNKKIETVQQLREALEKNLDNQEMYDKNLILATRVTK